MSDSVLRGVRREDKREREAESEREARTGDREKGWNESRRGRGRESRCVVSTERRRTEWSLLGPCLRPSLRSVRTPRTRLQTLSPSCPSCLLPVFLSLGLQQQNATTFPFILFFPPTINNHQQPSTTFHNHPQPSTTINNRPQPSTTINNRPQPLTTIHNHQQPSTTIQNHPQHLSLAQDEGLSVAHHRSHRGGVQRRRG